MRKTECECPVEGHMADCPNDRLQLLKRLDGVTKRQKRSLRKQLRRVKGCHDWAWRCATDTDYREFHNAVMKIREFARFHGVTLWTQAEYKAAFVRYVGAVGSRYIRDQLNKVSITRLIIPVEQVLR